MTKKKIIAILTDTKFFIGIVVAILVFGYNYGRKEVEKEVENKELTELVKENSSNVKKIVKYMITESLLNSILDSNNEVLRKDVKNIVQTEANKMSIRTIKSLDVVLDNMKTNIQSKSKEDEEKIKDMMRQNIEIINIRMNEVGEKKEDINYSYTSTGMMNVLETDPISYKEEEIKEKKKNLFNRIFIKEKTKTDY